MGFVERYVLRFRGPGGKPECDVEKVRALPDTTVLDESESRMLLVESSEHDVERLSEILPDWSISGERKIALPEQRPKVRWRP